MGAVDSMAEGRSLLSSLQHSSGTQQQSELPVNAIFPYLSFIFSLMYYSRPCIIDMFTKETI